MSRLVVRAGDGDARLDGDLDGAGSDADLDGLAGAGQAGLDSVAAGHDGSADADPPGDGEGGGQAGRPGGPGPGSAQPGPGPGRDGAGDSADQDPAGQDAGDRAAEPQGDALPGQRQPGADHVAAGADAARGVHGPAGPGHVPRCRGQRRRPGGLRSRGGEAGQIAGTEPGRQGLDAVPAEQDADLAEPGPEPHGPARHGDTLPAGHLRPPQPGHERLGLVN